METISEAEIRQCILRFEAIGRYINIEFLESGRRGVVLKGCFDGIPAAIKIANPKSKAMNRIRFEADWLSKLNDADIGPNLLHSDDDYLVMEFIEGELICDFSASASIDEVKVMLRKVLMQCRLMDKIGVIKEEMHRPVKHIIVQRKTKTEVQQKSHPSKKPHPPQIKEASSNQSSSSHKPSAEAAESDGIKPIMIDFERCRSSERPKNVSQFCQFLTRSNYSELLLSRGINIDKQALQDAVKVYMKSYSEKSFNEIISILIEA